MTDEEVTIALANLPGWETMGWKSAEEIRKVFKFGSFVQAWKFSSGIVPAIVGLEDHVNLEIYYPGRNLTPVRISLGHRGSVTPEDIALAQQVEQVYLKHKIA